MSTLTFHVNSMYEICAQIQISIKSFFCVCVKKVPGNFGDYLKRIYALNFEINISIVFVNIHNGMRE